MGGARAFWRTWVCAGILLIGPGCDWVARLSDRDLEVAYLGDESGAVERASVSTGTKVIASATRVAVRRTEDPGVTELDVDETHYVRGTLDVVYTGRLLFRCRADQAICDRIRVGPGSGTRPRDLFRHWPMTIGALNALPARRPPE